ncbi:MAG: cardiolipin synthase [Lacunisphaera sp.]
MEMLRQAWNSFREHPLTNGLLPHLLTVAGFLLAIFAIARLMTQRKQPGNTFAWLFAIAFVPYLGVPLYLLLGGRKLRKLAEGKSRLRPVASEAVVEEPDSGAFAARVFTRDGACPPVGGNCIRLLGSGEASYAAIEQGILQARESIHIMTFILGRDEVGQRLVELLAQRAREGVKVRLLLDAFGCFWTAGRFCDPIRKAGGEVVKFMPIMPLQTRGSANLRNHRKLGIIDHRWAAIGGRNLAKEYMGPTPFRHRWRDLGAVLEGPAVRQAEEVFLADWAYASGQSLAKLQKELPAEWPKAVGKSHLQIVASGPDVAGDSLYEGILSLVQQAERSVWIVTPYFIPDEVLQRSLIVQARAGIDVRLVVPAKSNHPLTDLARRYHLRELQSAGVKVLLYQSGMNHAKMLIVDGETALLGSANMDLRSLFVNFEIGLVTYSKDEAKAVREWVEEVFTHCKPMSERRRRPGVFAAIGEEIARLLAPLL